MKVINTYIRKIGTEEIYRYYETEGGVWWCERVPAYIGQNAFMRIIDGEALAEAKQYISTAWITPSTN